jgi:hypothetical protein
MQVTDKHYLRIISTAIWTFSDKKQLCVRMDKFLNNRIIIWILPIRQKGNLLCTDLFSKQVNNQESNPLANKNKLAGCCLLVVTLIRSAVSHMLRIPSLASSADDHSGSLKFGSYEISTPASLAAFEAAICAVLHGSVIRLIDP